MARNQISSSRVHMRDEFRYLRGNGQVEKYASSCLFGIFLQGQLEFQADPRPCKGMCGDVTLGREREIIYIPSCIFICAYIVVRALVPLALLSSPYTICFFCSFARRGLVTVRGQRILGLFFYSEQ